MSRSFHSGYRVAHASSDTRPAWRRMLSGRKRSATTGILPEVTEIRGDSLEYLPAAPIPNVVPTSEPSASSTSSSSAGRLDARSNSSSEDPHIPRAIPETTYQRAGSYTSSSSRETHSSAATVREKDHDRVLPPVVLMVDSDGEVTNLEDGFSSRSRRRRGNSRSSSSSGASYYIIPQGYPIIFEDEDGHEITRVGDFDRRSRSSYRIGPVIIQDEDGRELYRAGFEHLNGEARRADYAYSSSSGSSSSRRPHMIYLDDYRSESRGSSSSRSRSTHSHSSSSHHSSHSSRRYADDRRRYDRVRDDYDHRRHHSSGSSSGRSRYDDYPEAAEMPRVTQIYLDEAAEELPSPLSGDAPEPPPSTSSSSKGSGRDRYYSPSRDYVEERYAPRSEDRSYRSHRSHREDSTRSRRRHNSHGH